MPLFINEECNLGNHSSSLTNIDQQLERRKESERPISNKGSKKKKDSDNIFSQLLGRRRSNASSTSSTKSTKSNGDSGISSSPKRGSLVSSLESSSSTELKRVPGSRHDVMSSSYPSPSSPSLALGLHSDRPHSSYTPNASEALDSLPADEGGLASLGDFIEVLSWVQQRDQSTKVQKAAKCGLQQLAAAGAADVQQWTLSAHGFQGLEVKPTQHRNWGLVNTSQSQPK